jgi:hypothetical protein
MAWTAPQPLAVGEIITATDWGTHVTAIEQLQDNATQQVYNQTKTSYSWTSNAARQDFTSWSTADGFTSSGAGLLVPDAGCYLVSLIGILSSGSFTASTRYYLEVDSTFTFARGTAAAGVSETMVMAHGVTQLLPAGSIITPYRFQNTGSSITLSTVRLLIVKIPVLSA